MAKFPDTLKAPSFGLLIVCQVIGFVLLVVFLTSALISLLVGSSFLVVGMYLICSGIAILGWQKATRLFYYWYEEVLPGGRIYRVEENVGLLHRTFLVYVEGTTRFGVLRKEQKKLTRTEYEALDFTTGRVCRYNPPVK